MAANPIIENGSHHLGRRAFIVMAGGAAAGLVVWPRLSRGEVITGTPGKVKIVRFSDAGKRLGEVKVPKVVKSEEEWREQLSKASFLVTRRAMTERPWSGLLVNEHDTGVFRCICCNTALYDSDTKFDSGTGWPSFYEPIASENVTKRHDTSHGMVRTEITCTRCDAHLGHVFRDGPPPTGLRYCMNSVALTFSKAA